MAQATSDYYKIVVSLDEEYNSAYSGRHFNGVTLSGSVDGTQSETSITSSDKIYNSVTDNYFTARAGETLTASFSYNGTWMNGFVYMDFGCDGQFDAELTSEGLIPDESDILAFSYAEVELGSGSGKNSEGTELTAKGRNVLNPPSFTLPSTLADGFYLMRFKVDWASIDPAGRAEDGDGIIRNGGGIMDIRMNIHGDNYSVSATAENGTITTTDGEAIALSDHPYGTSLTVKLTPDDGLALNVIRVRHGHNLSGEQYVYGVAQYVDTEIPAKLVSGDEYEIPAYLFDGDVEITAVFAEPVIEYYPVVFLADQEYNSDFSGRHFNGITLSGSVDGTQSETSIASSDKIYNSITDNCFTARAGETLTASFSYSSDWMNGFVYMDFGCDGQFDAELTSEGLIPEESDILAFSYAEVELGSGSGKNSAGTALSGNGCNVLNPPSFTLPSTLADGFYLMRFKVDWASIDPAGRAEDGNGIIRNGGGIMDIRMNIHGDSYPVSVIAENGTITAIDGSELSSNKYAFGEPLIVKSVPEDGYALDALYIRHGHNLQGEQSLYGVEQYTETIIPGYLINGDEYELPATIFDGEVEITASFLQTIGATTADGPYTVNHTGELATTTDVASTLTLTRTSGSKALDLSDLITDLYNDITPAEFIANTAEELSFALDTIIAGTHCYLYIDYNQDGSFTVMANDDGTPTVSSELVSYSYHNGKNSAGEEVDAETATELPAFSLSEYISQGVYRARLKVDYDNIDAAGSDDIADKGGYIVDFLLRIVPETCKLDIYSYNGSVNGDGNSALPLTTTVGASLNLVPVPVADGYEASEMVIRHGCNLTGEQYINGNRQWSEYSVEPDTYTIPADSVNGDVSVYIEFIPTDDAEYRLVFSDEFDIEDGSQPTSDKWGRCIRSTATWNRYLSDSELVVYIEDGKLVTRAIPNPDTSVDNVPMLTGGVQSRGLFGFTYGKVECRLLTNPWTGNFPALWMMPEDQSLGWPNDGEIDIFETIDTQNRSWHTVHSNWTYNLGNTGNPTSSFSYSVSLDRYHTYAIEWTSTSITWFVDGVQVAKYAKSSTQSDLDNGQWPFDDHFYLILNQSVGSGAWAANPDVTHTYETLFDWVRVYQKEGMDNTDGKVGVVAATIVPEFEIDATESGITVYVSSPMQLVVCELSGRVVYNTYIDGATNISLPQGVYIVNGKKVLVK